MLPKLYHQCYQEFIGLLEQLQQAVAAAQLGAKGLRQSFLEAQQFFQQQILSLDTDDLEPADEPRVRSYQTEISKQMQLLGMDVMFLQAARQPQTAKTRQTQILQRLQILISYCEAMISGTRK
jgi:septum formation inhibitor MinC